MALIFLSGKLSREQKKQKKNHRHEHGDCAHVNNETWNKKNKEKKTFLKETYDDGERHLICRALFIQSSFRSLSLFYLRVLVQAGSRHERK